MHSSDEKRSLLGNKEIVQDSGPSKVVPFPVSNRIHSKTDASDPGVSSDKRSEIPAQTGVEPAMTETPSREEINARLEAAEARTGTRFAQLTGTIDVRFANLDNKIDRLVESVGLLSTQMLDVRREVRAENKTTRWTIVGIAIAAVIAALAALWITQANMLASFQAALAVKTMQSEPPKH